MKRKLLKWMVGIVCAGCFLNLAFGQVKHGKTRLLKTEQLMEGVVKPHSADLKKGLEATPGDAKAWKKLAVHAALLNEVSYILMEDGRCPDQVWAEAASKTLRESSAACLKAIEAQDIEGARQAFGNMNKSCKACHDKHKE